MTNPKDFPLVLGMDHPSVQQVIEIALRLTEENKLINVDLLYNRVQRELKIPRQGLNKIIQMLLNRKILVDGSKFTKETVLKNRVRGFIYWLIKTNIGAHFSFLKKEISQQKKREMGVGHLIWHLEKLIKFNLIKKIKVKNCTLFLPIEISDEEGILYFILRDELNRQIVEFLFEHEMVNKGEIYKELNVKRETVHYRITKLNELGVISYIKKNEKFISINSSKRDLLEDIIEKISYNKQINERTKLISMKI
jgi:predicted transcriptional regulator